MSSSLVLSPLESSRFGLRVARWRGDDLEIGALAAAIRELDIDLAIVRVRSADLGKLRALDRLGFDTIHADTLIYHTKDLQCGEAACYRNPGLAFESASLSSVPELENLVRLCFDGYQSHYASNPSLDAAAVLEGYVEWARGHADGHDPNLETWLVRCSDNAIAFACCKDDSAAAQVEVVLNGVQPTHAGKGIYGDLLSFVRKEYGRRGRQRLIISTQQTNAVVQRAWRSQGFTLSDSWETFHISPRQAARAKP